MIFSEPRWVGDTGKWQEIRLGIRIAGVWAQAKVAAGGSLSEDKAKALEAIGMTWGGRHDARREERYRLAEQSCRGHGHPEIPGDYMAGDVRLTATSVCFARPGRGWDGAVKGLRLTLRPAKYQKSI